MSTDLSQKIYVAGHRGMVGSAIVRNLEAQGFRNIVTRTHDQLDLTNQAAVQSFFEQEKPTQVYMAAAKVGGIHANNTFPAEFIYDNLMVQGNVIHQAFLSGVKKLEMKKRYYQTEIDKARKTLTELQTNPAALEKFARERYLMKKDGEDIFTLEDSTAITK